MKRALQLAAVYSFAIGRLSLFVVSLWPR